MTVVLKLEPPHPELVVAFGMYGIEHFSTCVLASRFPEHVYDSGDHIDDALVVCFVAENFMSCFSGIMEVQVALLSCRGPAA